MDVRVLSGEARGLRVVIEPRAEKYYWTGTHHKRVQEALARLARPGVVFWDIGAHIGFFAMTASRLGATVHAFEPMPETFHRLERGVELNDLPVHLHQCAVNDTDGEVWLYKTGSSLTTNIVGQGMPGVKVSSFTLDTLVHQFGPPDLIKVDVEGAEVPLIRGGTKLWRTNKPVIVMEFLSREALTAAMAYIPNHRYEQLDHENWLLTPNP